MDGLHFECFWHSDCFEHVCGLCIHFISVITWMILALILFFFVKILSWLVHVILACLAYVSHLGYHLLCGASLSLCVSDCVWLPHCPLLVGDHFVTVAVGDQMANWALCHVTSLHWGLSQSAQARLLNCCPHRHHSTILTKSSFRGPEGLFWRLTEKALL